LAIFSRSIYLRLDPEGFEIKSFFHKAAYKWSDVSDFQFISIRAVTSA
jgi:hypothetical protein